MAKSKANTAKDLMPERPRLNSVSFYQASEVCTYIKEVYNLNEEEVDLLKNYLKSLPAEEGFSLLQEGYRATEEKLDRILRFLFLQFGGGEKGQTNFVVSKLT